MQSDWLNHITPFLDKTHLVIVQCLISEKFQFWTCDDVPSLSN